MSAVIDNEKLAVIPSLKRGSHQPTDGEMCVMEAVAYVAGEPWSDAPQCACPVITAFMVSWNDSLPNDAERDRLLKPLIPLIVGTRSTKEIEERRSYMALDWIIRVYTPKWLEMVPALHAHAKELRELEAVADMAGATAAGIKVRLAHADAAAAWAAAWAAAGAAAWAASGAAAGEAAAAAAWAASWAASGAAAGDAAWVAAWAASWEAAGAASGAASGEAARAAAWAAAGAASGAAAAGAAAWEAAGEAARAAAGDALKPTTAWLQASALDLVQRMIAAKP